MKVECLACGSKEPFIVRGSLDKHENDLSDEIWECDKCHALMRIYYKIVKYSLLQPEIVKEGRG
jgi:hypothetical protein